MIFQNQATSQPKIGLLVVSQVPKYWATAFVRTNMIYGLEMLALLAFIFTMRHRLAGKSINIYIDNNNALCSLIRGDANTEIIAHMCATFWRALQVMGIDVWLGRVGSKLNIADLPTRDPPLPFPVGSRTEYKELFKLRALVKRIGNNLFKKNDFYRASRSPSRPSILGEVNKRVRGSERCFPRAFFYLRAIWLLNGK